MKVNRSSSSRVSMRERSSSKLNEVTRLLVCGIHFFRVMYLVGVRNKFGLTPSVNIFLYAEEGKELFQNNTPL